MSAYIAILTGKPMTISLVRRKNGESIFPKAELFLEETRGPYPALGCCLKGIFGTGFPWLQDSELELNRIRASLGHLNPPTTPAPTLLLVPPGFEAICVRARSPSRSILLPSLSHPNGRDAKGLGRR